MFQKTLPPFSENYNFQVWEISKNTSINRRREMQSWQRLKFHKLI